MRFENGQEDFDDPRIELCSLMLLQLGDGPFLSERLAVWPVGDHGIVSVHDGNDPGLDRDVLTREARRVAAAVVPLVVREYHGGHLLEEADLPDDLGAQAR